MVFLNLGPRSRLGIGLTAVVVLSASALVGCSAASPTTRPTSASSLPSTPPVAPSATSGSTAEPTPSGPAVSVFPVIHDGSGSHAIAAGSYVTDFNGFFPGLRLTVPDGWQSVENDAGEFHLVNPSYPDQHVLLWKDMLAVETNDREGKLEQLLDGVGSDEAAIATWLTNLSDVEILDGPEETTVGDSIVGTQLTLTTSDTADFGWDDCPWNPRCVDLLTDPEHWPHPYGIGGDETAQMFIGTIPFSDGDHTMYVTLQVPNPSDLDAFAEAAQPILESLIAPDVYVDN